MPGTDRALLNADAESAELPTLEQRLSVFHFGSFWTRAFHWCDFVRDPEAFPDPRASLARVKARGLARG
ncbi:MAG: hypothetical protein HYV60_23945, partial [Planctomycetia bacterium]|nr:hypothetical protein [Planctomycetia bacterium]